MYKIDFDYSQSLALIGTIETIKVEFKTLEEYAFDYINDIIDDIGGPSVYNKFVDDFKSKFKNLDEFKAFLKDNIDLNTMEIIHEIALNIIPFDINDNNYSIVDFIEDNFDVTGPPPPELNTDEKYLLIAWLNYYNLIPKVVYDEDSEQYIFNLWIDNLEEDEFNMHYDKVIEIKKDEKYIDYLYDLSSKITKPEVQYHIFESIFLLAADDDEDINDYEELIKLANMWNINLDSFIDSDDEDMDDVHRFN